MKTPNVAELNIERQVYQTLVCSVLNWTNEQYANAVYSQGLSFMDYHLKYESVKTHLASSKMFWNWFKLKWHERDYYLYSNVSELNPDAYLLTHEWALKSSDELIESFKSKLDAMLKTVSNGKSTINT